jgi:selenocysteine lyase/cysteine desulfurase
MRTTHSAVSRRAFLGTAGIAGAALTTTLRARDSAQAGAALNRPNGAPAEVARDEAYWQRVAAHYRVTSKVTNLEAGYWGMMAGPVMAEFIRQTERVNVENSFYARGAYREEMTAVRQRVASALGADPTEIALTRGATEALQCLIGGYARLKPGDAVMYADLDYPAMQYAMNWLTDRRGVRVVRIVIPEPATYDNVLETYRAALLANPQVRLLLLTHVNNKTGLMIPTAAIAEEARRRGVDVIVDAAHSFGQVDIRAADVGADFIGFNLHKWIGAPVGIGVMYIRKGRLADTERMMADEDAAADSILSRVHTGTTNFATTLTVPAALDFHDAIGRAHKAARVRYLRDRWVTAARAIPGVDILTPDDPRMTAAITSFRLRGRTSGADTQRIVEELRDRHGFFTVRRNGVEAGDCVRVTPSLYNAPGDLDRFVAALRQVAAGA